MTRPPEVHPTSARAMPSVKPSGKHPASSITPRAIVSVKPAVSAPPSLAQQQSPPPNSIRPVSLPPRPSSASPKSEIPTDVGAPEAVTPASSVPQALPQNPASAPPAEADPAIQLAAAVEGPALPAPVANVCTNALEAAPSPPSSPAEWIDASQDTLRPSQVELDPVLSIRQPLVPPRKILLAAAIAALVAVIWLVVSSTRSKPNAIAALPTAPPVVQASRAHPAQPAAAVKPPSTGTTATPVTSGPAPGLVESAKSSLLGPDDTALVTVRISPSNAVVFKDGQRFGTGEVTVNVVRGTRTRLYARLDGYLPRTIVVDGTKASVNITLSRPEPARVTAARKPGQEETVSAVKSDEANPAQAGEPSESAPKRVDSAASDTSNSESASDPQPTPQLQTQPNLP
jgi:hypothetical protein